jgi:hypothetical protein
MHILIGLGLFLVLLYFWLIGHWFARVVMFLLLACAGFAGGASVVGWGIYGRNAPLALGLLGGAIGAAIAVLGASRSWEGRCQEGQRSLIGMELTADWGCRLE